ncbi:MAG TPA: UDP-N-acetylglucosamine--N-acetylmuramyl-(pentapeptide) pyrophosphoryl-undecaprenol N-acetylglucosamine transferase, partial [Bacillota bacterium]
MGGRPLRVLLTGGGTAGHVFPALALATELRRLEPGVEFLYIGTRAGLEAGLVPAAGLPFATVRAQGLVGRRPLAAMRALWELVRGYREARQLIGRFRPHVAVGTGGYVTGPVLLAAARAGVPLVLHEQNAFPGAANRWLSRFAELVAVPFDETHRYFGRAARVVTTGNPVRPEIVTTSRDEGLRAFGLDGERPVVLIVSGSRGAQAINEASVAMLTGPPLDAQVILVTGRRYYDAVVARLAAAGVSLD